MRLPSLAPWTRPGSPGGESRLRHAIGVRLGLGSQFGLCVARAARQGQGQHEEHGRDAELDLQGPADGRDETGAASAAEAAAKDDGLGQQG